MSRHAAISFLDFVKIMRNSQLRHQSLVKEHWTILELVRESGKTFWLGSKDGRLPSGTFCGIEFVEIDKLFMSGADDVIVLQSAEGARLCAVNIRQSPIPRISRKQQAKVVK